LGGVCRGMDVQRCANICKDMQRYAKMRPSLRPQLLLHAHPGVPSLQLKSWHSGSASAHEHSPFRELLAQTSGLGLAWALRRECAPTAKHGISWLFLRSAKSCSRCTSRKGGKLRLMSRRAHFSEASSFRHGHAMPCHTFDTVLSVL
jgi:hypothetical protein